MSDVFNAMGKPIPYSRRDAAYQQAKQIGVSDEDAFALIDGMAHSLEKDRPNQAMETAVKYVDITGAYRLLAYLLTGPITKEG